MKIFRTEEGQVRVVVELGESFLATLKRQGWQLNEDGQSTHVSESARTTVDPSGLYDPDVLPHRTTLVQKSGRRYSIFECGDCWEPEPVKVIGDSPSRVITTLTALPVDPDSLGKVVAEDVAAVPRFPRPRQVLDEAGQSGEAVPGVVVAEPQQEQREPVLGPELREVPDVGEVVHVGDKTFREASSLKDLRWACKFLQIPQSGKKAVLWDRLKKEVAMSQLKVAVKASDAVIEAYTPDVRQGPLPVKPDAQTVMLHELTHIPRMDWCESCQAARSKEDDHPVAEPKRQVNVVSMDFMFNRTGDSAPQEEHPLTTQLVAVCHATKYVICVPLESKSPDAAKHAVEEVVKMTSALGYAELVLRADSEPAMKKMCQLIALARTRLGFKTEIEEAFVPKKKVKGVVWEKAVYLGKSSIGDLNIVANASGVHYARTIRRAAQVYQAEMIVAMKGVPWNPTLDVVAARTKKGGLGRVPLLAPPAVGEVPSPMEVASSDPPTTPQASQSAESSLLDGMQGQGSSSGSSELIPAAMQVDQVTRDESEESQSFVLRRKFESIEKGLVITQDVKYAERLVGLLELEKANVKRTPMPQQVPEPGVGERLDAEMHALYRKCIGLLLYMSSERPDSQYGFQRCNPGRTVFQKWEGRDCEPEDWDPKKYPFGLDHVVEVVTDADWGSKTFPERRSISAYVILINGNVCHCGNKVQKTISLSSAESELMASLLGVTEAMFVAEMVRFICGPNSRVKLVHYVDNSAARSIIQKQGLQRTRHVSLAWLWIQRSHHEGVFVTKPISTRDAPADLQTKSHGRNRLKYLMSLIGMSLDEDDDAGHVRVQRVRERATTVQGSSIAAVMRALAVILEGGEALSFDQERDFRGVHVPSIVVVMIVLGMIGTWSVASAFVEESGTWTMWLMLFVLVASVGATEIVADDTDDGAANFLQRLCDHSGLAALVIALCMLVVVIYMPPRRWNRDRGRGSAQQQPCEPRDGCMTYDDYIHENLFDTWDEVFPRSDDDEGGAAEAYVQSYVHEGDDGEVEEAAQGEIQGYVHHDRGGEPQNFDVENQDQDQMPHEPHADMVYIVGEAKRKKGEKNFVLVGSADREALRLGSEPRFWLLSL
ncbi:unnamed protein product [Symbiodinium sp. CCMP2592]|nr:unnamed protein product [Symbiodinium sp. CCMP2592]